MKINSVLPFVSIAGCGLIFTFVFYFLSEMGTVRLGPQEKVSSLSPALYPKLSEEKANDRAVKKFGRSWLDKRQYAINDPEVTIRLGKIREAVPARGLNFMEGLIDFSGKFTYRLKGERGEGVVAVDWMEGRNKGLLYVGEETIPLRTVELTFSEEELLRFADLIVAAKLGHIQKIEFTDFSAKYSGRLEVSEVFKGNPSKAFLTLTWTVFKGSDVLIDYGIYEGQNKIWLLESFKSDGSVTVFSPKNVHDLAEREALRKRLDVGQESQATEETRPNRVQMRR